MQTVAVMRVSPELPLELLDDFDRQLGEQEPFCLVHHGWLRTQGGGRTGKQLSSHWAWRRLLAGAEPAALLAEARNHIAPNSYDILEVRPIYGVKIAHRLNLGPDAYICPITELPQSNNFSRAFLAPTYAGLPPLRRDGSALVFRLKIEPAIVPERTDPETDSRADERALTSMLVRHALPLLTDGPVEMPSEYTDQAVDTLFGSGGGFVSSGQPVSTNLGWLRNPDDLPGLMQNIKNMKSPAVMLSIDRLTTSRLKDRLEDRILDLGIAAEIALMHETSGGSGDGKGEITAKMSSRGAWLLGHDGTERLAISKELKALYGARSKVAHSGRADTKLEDKLPSFDKLVVQILRGILRREAFPEWSGLVLGANLGI
jgi:hypothetical protein